jgi:hypothetical protein
MISGAVLMVSLGVLATIARALTSSAETLSSTAEDAIVGTANAGSPGLFFDFLTLSSSLSFKSLSQEANCLRGKSIASCFSPYLAAIF